MKNIGKLTTNYIIKTLRSKDIFYFTPRLLGDIFDLSGRNIYIFIDRLKKQEFICEVERGKYLVLGLEPERVLSNPFFMATKIITPSYVSYWNMLHFYGFTEQVPARTIFVATTEKRPSIKFRKTLFKYITIRPYKFFGYRREIIGDLHVVIADEEKSIIDSLDHPEYAGGIEEAAKCLENAIGDKRIKISKLIEYSIRMKNKSLCSRLGFLLERFNISAKKLRRYTSSSYVLLDPDKPRSKTWNKKWHLNINLTEKQLTSWKEIY